MWALHAGAILLICNAQEIIVNAARRSIQEDAVGGLPFGLFPTAVKVGRGQVASGCRICG